MNRSWIIGGIVAAVVLVSVLVAVSIAGGDKGDGDIAGVNDVNTLLEGIPQEGLMLGQKNAPVTIVEFAEPQCPNCKQASVQIIPDLIERYVKTGEARLQLSPLVFLQPTSDSDRAAKAIIAAGEQGKAWHFTEVLYKNQGSEGSGWISEGFVNDVAAAVGIDKAAFDTARKGDVATKGVDDARKLAEANDVQGTPSFLVRDAKGTKQVTVQDFSPAGFDAAVAAVK